MPKRKGITKSVRFSVFSRDGFTCRYCGRQPSDVVLVVDHIVPVAKGGDNDPANLITACFDCNSGKSAKTIAGAVPTVHDQKRLEQERAELEAAAFTLAELRRHREDHIQQTVNLLCEMVGRDSFNLMTARIISGYFQEFGPDVVYPWVAKAVEKVGYNDSRIGKYVSGCRRIYLSQEAEQ